MKVVWQLRLSGFRTDKQALFRRQRELSIPMLQQQRMIFLDETVSARITHGFGHPPPDLFQGKPGGVAEAHGGEIAGANLAQGINEQMLSASAAAEDFRTLNLVEGADFWLKSLPI